jgi:WXG100 family type VII secretion target
MSTDIIQANYAHLDAVAARFGQHAELVATLDSRVRQGVAALADGGWEGAGSAAFLAEMQGEVFPTLQRFRQALEEARAVTLEAKIILQQAEEEAARVFQGDGNSAEGGVGGEAVGYVQGSAANGSGGSGWEHFWRSAPGQQGLAVVNAAWAFLVGSGHEFGERYGPAAKMGSFGGDALSSFLIWGDVRDLAVEGFNAIMPGRDANEVTAILAGMGLAMDLGWLDGPIPDPLDGGNAAMAVLKATAKQLDALPEPTQRALVGLLQWCKDNPSRIVDVAHLAEWTLKNHDSPVGQGMIDMFKRGANDSDWFNKSLDVAEWIKKDPDRLADLASDAAQGGQVSAKTLFEARVGLTLEEAGALKAPITRDRTQAAEFIDADGVSWDVKSFYAKRPGSFQLDREVRKIGDELRLGENVILDTSDLGPSEIEDLRKAVTSNKWDDRVLWYP